MNTDIGELYRKIKDEWAKDRVYLTAVQAVPGSTPACTCNPPANIIAYFEANDLELPPCVVHDRPSVVIVDYMDKMSPCGS